MKIFATVLCLLSLSFAGFSQGADEDGRIMFSQHYMPTHHEKFDGTITRPDRSTITYNDKTFRLSDICTGCRGMFDTDLLYP